MSALTIEARRVAGSVGLPAVWRCRKGDDVAASVGWVIADTMRERQFVEDGYSLDLSNHQAAFGVALKLDAWERAGDGVWHSWALNLARFLERPDHDALLGAFLLRMIARITAIYFDHEIRRALGCDPEPGTMATVKRFVAGIWFLDMPDGERWSFQDYDQDTDDRHRYAPALAGITDEPEAREAIGRSVTEGGDDDR
jgi:hypothetical protein